MPRCGRCAGTHYKDEGTVWYRTECANCHSIEHGAVYDGCPVDVDLTGKPISETTYQNNNMASNSMSNKHAKRKRKQLEERTFTQAVNNTKPNMTPANSSSANRLVTRQIMESHTAYAVFTAASFILKEAGT